MDSAKELLRLSRGFVKVAHDSAKALHDDPNGGAYLELVNYEIMQETESLLIRIDKLLEESP